MTNISVVIPSYNQKEYLKDAIESVISQEVQPAELIIVDDGSDDGSLEIAKSYERPYQYRPEQFRIRVISQVNKGLASARNTGIMNSYDGFDYYVLFLDADDILLPDAIEEISKVIDETSSDIVSPSFKCFGKGNEEVILMKNPKLEDFREGNRIPYFSAIKKTKLLEIGGYSPRMIHGYEDLHLTVNLLKRGARVVTIPKPLVLYRTKEKSMWTESLKHHEQLMNQIKKDFPKLYANS